MASTWVTTRVIATWAVALLVSVAFASACGPPLPPLRSTSTTPKSTSTQPPFTAAIPAAHCASNAAATTATTTIFRDVPALPAAGAFEVTSHSALLWAYGPVIGKAQVVLRTTYEDPETNTRTPVRVGVYPIELSEATGRTAVVDVTDLRPNHDYHYKVQFGDGSATPWHRFRTAPSLDDGEANVHFIFGADVSSDPRYASPAFETMANTGAQFFVSLGDWPYTDIPLRDEALAQYRASHRYARLLPPAQTLMRAMSLYAIYDDHEIRDNWDRGSMTDLPERHAAGIQAWDEFFPLRTTSPSNATPPRRYRKIRRGQHVELFILDTRLYRSPYRDTDGPAKTMLGAEQRAWLEAGLTTSTATFKLVMCTVPLAYGTTKEHWNAYTNERDALIQEIVVRNIRGVVFLTADQHWFAAHHHDSGIREFQVGPIMAFTRTPPAVRAPQVVGLATEPNFGEVLIDRDQMTLMVRNDTGKLLYAETLTP